MENRITLKLMPVFKLLAAVIIFVTAVTVTASATAAVGGWVEENADIDGLNFNPACAAFNPSVVRFDGEWYASWQENNKIRVARQSSSDKTWTFIDGGGAGGLNYNPDMSASNPNLAVYDGSLYAVWTESCSITLSHTRIVQQVRVARYNGSGWVFVDGMDSNGVTALISSNYNNSAYNYHHFSYVGAASDSTGLYVVWSGRYSDHYATEELFAAKYDGTSWSIIGGTSPDAGLNYNTAESATSPSLATDGTGRLYLAWIENGAVHVKYYDGSSWSHQSGSGLNFDISRYVNFAPKLVFYNSVPYIAWSEADALGVNQIRVKKYISGGWSAVGDSQNYNSSKSGYQIALAADTNNLYLGWTESSQFRIKKYNPTDGWEHLDSDGISAGGNATGLNMDLFYIAYNVAIGAGDGELCALFTEYDPRGFIPQVQFKSYDPAFELASDADQIAGIVPVNGELYPAFSPDVSNYTILLDKDAVSGTFAVNLRDSGSMVICDGVCYTGGGTITVNSLQPGDNHLLLRLVTPKASIVKRIYVRLNRAVSDTQRMVSPVYDTGYDSWGFYPYGDTGSFEGEAVNWIGSYFYSAMSSGLRFDFDFIAGDIIDAELGIKIKAVEDFRGGEDPYISLYGSYDEAWTSNSASAPTKDMTIVTGDSTGLTAGAVKSFDVSDYMDSLAAKTGIFVLEGNVEGEEDCYFYYYSAENPTDKPYLLLTYTPSANSLPTAGFGKAISLNGTDEKVLIPYNDAYSFTGSDNYTISLWFWQNESTGNQTLYRQRALGYSSCGIWLFCSDGKINVGLDKSGIGWQWFNGTDSVPLGQWNHVALTKSGGDLTIYVNGEIYLEATIDSIRLFSTATSGANYAGGDTVEGNHFNGLIDELQVFDLALNQNTIREWMYHEVDESHPDYASLKLYYQFNDENEAAATDSVGTHHGTLNNMDGGNYIHSTVRNWITDENTPFQGRLVGSDVDGCLGLVYEIVSSGSKGTAVIDSGNVFIYTPNEGVSGDDTFTYRVRDAQNAVSDTQTVYIAINLFVPTVTDSSISISGATGIGGTYKIGDTVTATWNNTATGDNNTGTVSGVTFDFSAFGGGSAVPATNMGGVWTATYTIVAGSIDGTGKNVSVTVTGSGGSTTAADSTNATVDNVPPVVTDAKINIGGATGVGGTFIIGDTVAAGWNNTAAGDNNTDTISSVTFDFSAFGGGFAVPATNNGGVWTATYTIVAGSIDGTNKNVSVTVTDNAGNSRTVSDTTNAKVDNIAPVVTDANISLSGATGIGGTYKIGDTVTATWDNTVMGDNNADTISGVTVNFSAFGGGIAVPATNTGGIWTATYTIVAGIIDGTNKNVSVTVTDNAGNSRTADSTNATVDNVAPVVTDANISISEGNGTDGTFIIGDNVTATWNNTAAGDNNADTISGVTFDFSAFGGGIAVPATNTGGIWTATYTVVAGNIEGTGKNISVTVTDNAGNSTTAADTSNATVDCLAPLAPSAPDLVSDSGTSDTDNVTSNTTPTFTGTAEANCMVTVYSGATALGSGVADEAGNWSITTSGLAGGTYIVKAKTADAAGNLSNASAGLTVFIVAAEPTVSLSSSGSAIAENGGTASITATLSGISDWDVTVNLAFTGTAAGSGTDYTASASSITIPTGSLTGSMTITAADDTIFEENETVLVDISSVTNGTENGAQQATVTITDDDTMPTVTLEISGSAIAENGGSATVTARLSNLSYQDVTVSLAFSGTAAGSGTDYTVSASITVPAGSLTGSAPITAVSDSLDEYDETVIIDISGVTNGTESGTQQEAVTITDDDAEPTISVSDPSVAEGNAGTANLEFTVSLSAASAKEIRVDYASAEGTATAGTDYASVSGTLTFSAGDTSKTVSVLIIGDIINEANETVLLNLSAPLNASISDPQGSGTITDDDMPPAISVDDVTVTEGDSGTATATFTVTIDNASSYAITVDYEALDETAFEGEDYTLTPGTLTFSAGETSKTVGITIYGDTKFELDEVFYITLSGAVNAIIGDGTGQATILDNDAAPTVTLEISGITIAENSGSVTVTATLSNLSYQDVTVDLAFTGTAEGSGTDYTTSAASITIPAGSLTGSMTITAVGDSLDEDDETVVIDIAGVTNGTESGTQRETATITDDDSEPTISISDPSVTEGDSGATTLRFIVSLSSKSGKQVVVAYRTSGGTASEGTDYQAAANFVILGPGATQGQISISVYGDEDKEADETIVVELYSPINASISDAYGTGTILDDDSGAEVLVNGKTQTAGDLSTSVNPDGQTVTTVTVNTGLLHELLENEDSGATVTIPITGETDVASGVLTGDMVKYMEDNDATLIISTDSAAYTIPASEINIDLISEMFGEDVNLEDIEVSVDISEPDVNMVTVIENSAEEGGFSLAVPAVEFTISCTYNGRSVEVDTFSAYIERKILIPDGVDPQKVTTAVIINPDGSAYHVPTRITVIDGRYYAVINSMTNSVYALIRNEVSFDDVAGHWAGDNINEMGSRRIINGVGDNLFEPERDITRAEFAAIVVRALGLAPGTGESLFDDVYEEDWYCGYVQTASECGLITGYGDGSFGPNDSITREQAMAIIARAMDLTGLEADLTEDEVNALLGMFPDYDMIYDYARDCIAVCLKTGIVNGRDGLLAPKEYITRAEVAVIVQRLLQKSELI